MNIIRLSANLSALSAAALVILLPTFALYCLRLRSTFKKNAYLMMCVVLLLVSMPAMIGSGWLGWQLYQGFSDHFSASGLTPERANELRGMFVAMFTKHAWMNFLGPAGFVTIVILLLFKPLRIPS